MCCVVTSLFFLGPRVAILLWWLIQPVRWQAAFSSFIVPLIGFLFLPWTTLAWVVVAPGGVTGFEWFVLVLGFLVDIASYTGGGYGNRQRVPGYSR
jgi:hypothetical protein